MFLSQTTAFHSLTYMLLVVFGFVGDDVLFKNCLVYKGGELGQEREEEFNSYPFSYAPSSTSQLHILLQFSPLFFGRCCQLVYCNIFLIIFPIS